MNSGGQLTASNAARLLAIQSAQSGRNVVLCDTTGQIEKEIKEKTTNRRICFFYSQYKRQLECDNW